MKYNEGQTPSLGLLITSVIYQYIQEKILWRCMYHISTYQETCYRVHACAYHFNSCFLRKTFWSKIIDVTKKMVNKPKKSINRLHGIKEFPIFEGVCNISFETETQEQYYLWSRRRHGYNPASPLSNPSTRHWLRSLPKLAIWIGGTL